MKRTARFLLIVSAFTLAHGALAHAQRALGHHNSSASAEFRGMPNGNAPAGEVSKLPLRSLLYPGATTKIYARLMPFFTKGGSKDHKDVGYDSDDQNQVSSQVDDMVSRGIDGAILDWYGPDKEHHNRVAHTLKKAAEAHGGFEFAVTEDNGALKPCAQSGCDVTQRLIDDLNYAYREFESSPAYMRWHGHPVVFFFDADKYIHDWSRVKHSVKGDPVFIFRNSGAFAHEESGGGFAWFASQEGMPYLDRFYAKAKAAGSDKLTVGSVYKGFDDSQASWGKGAKIEQRCGQTWLDTWGEIDRLYDSRHQLDAVQLVTWNDYEEGTELETGVDTCAQLTARLDGSRITWGIGAGNPNAIDHFEVLALGVDGSPLARLGIARANERSFSISGVGFPSGARSIAVKMEARAGLRNLYSAPLALPRQ